MAHGFEEKDTMFSVRQVPWHQLGVVVQEAPNAKEAIRLAGLDWSVSKQPLICAGQVVPGRYGIVRETDNSCLGICGDWYNVIQNEFAFDFLENLVGEELRYETAGSIYNGRKIFITTKFRESWRIGDDDIDLYLLISNAHTGQDALRVAVTPVRVVCNNTLQAALGNAKRQWSMVHSENIAQKFEEARRTLQLTEIYMKNFVAFGNRAIDTTVSSSALEQISELLFPKPNENCKTQKGWTMREKKIDALWKCYDAADIRPYRDTAWGVINAVADYESHHRTKNLDVTMGRALTGEMRLLQTAMNFLGI